MLDRKSFRGLAAKQPAQDARCGRITSCTMCMMDQDLRAAHASPVDVFPAQMRTPAVRLRLLGGMTIKVKTLTGRELEIDIEPTDTVERIKQRVEEKEGIPPIQQRLIFAGRQMNDEKTAKDYNIEGGSVLHLVLALRGGSVHRV